MSNISAWDTSAGGNNSTPPDGWPEGMAPSTVNNAARENMAAIARWYGDMDGTLASTGLANAYVLTTNSAHAALADQSMLVFKANFANTGAATLAVDGLLAKSIKKNHDVDLASGDIEANQIVVVSYNATDDVYEMVSNVGRDILTASNTFTKTQTWTKGSDVASASALSLGDGNYFDITGTIAITSIGTKGVGTVVKLHFDAALTLTHHSTDLVLPGGANVTTAAGDEAEFVEYATGDWRCTIYTKASGEAVVAPTVALAESFTSSAQTITGGGALTLAHGLSAAPGLVQVRLKCTTAEFGYSIGDEILVHTTDFDGTAVNGFGLFVDATNVVVQFANVASPFVYVRKASAAGGNATLTNGSWQLYVRAWA